MKTCKRPRNRDEKLDEDGEPEEEEGSHSQSDKNGAGFEDESLMKADFKKCLLCCRVLPLSFYYINSCGVQGRHSRCKECCCNKTKKKKLTCDEETSKDSDPPLATPLSLYILHNTRIPGELKIGKTSRNVDERVRDLCACQNFQIETLCIFPGMGEIEARVHRMLENRRVKSGSGREWFRVTLIEAVTAIMACSI